MKKLKLAFLIFISLFILDQIIKYGFVNFHWGAKGSVISLQLAYNHGVAFSMLSFLNEYLKYIQLLLMLGILIYLYKNKDFFEEYYIPTALLFAGGLSNILDRFTYGGVVDYVYWHYLFDFAIFNLADVIIDSGLVIVIYKHFKQSKEEKSKK